MFSADIRRSEEACNGQLKLAYLLGNIRTQENAYLNLRSEAQHKRQAGDMVTLGVISMMVMIMIDCALCQTEIEQPACKVRIVTPDPCEAVHLVSRSDWGAVDPTQKTPLDLPVSMTSIHHTLTEGCCNVPQCSARLQAIQSKQMTVMNFDDIGCNFLVGNDGRIYEGRGWTNKGQLIQEYDELSHSICFIGNYTEDAPSWFALDSAKKWIECGVNKDYIVHQYMLFGHREKDNSTQCPGDCLFSIIARWPHFPYFK
ncbi:hypothetical protein LSH36_747g01010 [Paralvinella palmiformis]|uniref:Uncharacterized protein n=1 Tax=Paralvinella palmiformis TaxID=53620 RepID=A0AAD9J1G7_9ANNE|nr:hypothetical protein LSH36_747g01010 [Paralvinella palmiformis]